MSADPTPISVDISTPRRGWWFLRIAVFLIAAWVAGEIIGCRHPGRDEPLSSRDSPMIVELDIFSGRPNPSWELSPEQARELQQRLSFLRQGKVSARPFDGLGYRGLIARDPADPVSLLKVGFGRVIRVHGATESVYEDEGRVLEAWLLATGRGKIDGDLMAIPLDSVAGPHK